MQKIENHMQLGIGYLRPFLLLTAIMLLGCKRERPTTIVTTSETVVTAESVARINPTIAAILADATATAHAEGTTVSPATTIPPTTAPSFVCEPPDDWVVYTVQANDTLFAIAGLLDITVGDIKNANCKLDDDLAIGERLFLPVLPSIPQAPPANPVANLVPNPIQGPANPSLSLNNLTAELPEGVSSELSFFTGGGAYDEIFDDCVNDKKPITLRQIDDRQFNRGLMVVVCLPQSGEGDSTISATLIYPTGETVPLELNNKSFYNYSENAYTALHNLPVAHSYGDYKVVVENFPEEGMTVDQTINIQKGHPGIETDDVGRTIMLFYFEPSEMVSLMVIDAQEEKMLGVLTYQMNEDGYLLIEEVDPQIGLNIDSGACCLVAAWGDVSGFTSMRTYEPLLAGINIVNRGLIPICGFWMSPTGTIRGSPLLFQGDTIEPGGVYQVPQVSAGIYDVEVLDCDGNLLSRMDNMKVITGIVEWQVP